MLAGIVHDQGVFCVRIEDHVLVGEHEPVGMHDEPRTAAHGDFLARTVFHVAHHERVEQLRRINVMHPRQVF
jgi:hypothetical protein